jgi:hypothetical protein
MTKETKYYFVDFAIKPDLSEINPEEIKGLSKTAKPPRIGYSCKLKAQ